MTSVLVAGDTCRTTAHADRIACIIDAADYFAHAKSALRQARRRAILIGWDFDTRIGLDPSDESGTPDELGDFLQWLVRERPDLEVYVLRWSVGAVTGVARGMLPPFVQNLVSHPRLHYRVDAAHPVSAAHHQKIVVIDDALAFCGGIDMTVDRWDTSDHTPDDPRRETPTGEPYGPWHDVTTALDGEAARVVARVAYERWEAATGRRLPMLETTEQVWPDGLTPSFTDCTVGVSRTLADYDGRPGVFEIRRLYLAAIAAARTRLYLESQYLASRDVAEALAARLREPDGPEVVLVLPRHADGELERRAMDGARHRLLRLLWHADVHDRFRAYYPVAADGEPIYVHAKVAIVDDELLRVGSSNLNNRSLGLDSECDVTVEAALTPDRADEIRATIAGFRTRLVSEHLGVAPADVGSALDAHGSLIAAVESLSGRGRTLRRFDRENTSDEDSVFAENELVDPERAPSTLVDRLVRAVLRRW